MSSRVEFSNINLVNRYYQDFPPQINFSSDSQGTPIEGFSSSKFTSSRVALIDNYLSQNNPKKEMSQALLVEEFSNLALEKLLKEKGFSSHLAPQNLESGQNQKGVDLIIQDSQKMLCLGIDLKLKKSKSLLKRDGYGWSPNTKSPYIYLKMGDCFMKTKEESSVNLRDWIQDYTLSKITSTGKIPHLDQFRKYIICRIERTLFSYIQTIKEPSNFIAQKTIPKDHQDQLLLEEKLFKTHALFSSLCQELT